MKSATIRETTTEPVRLMALSLYICMRGYWHTKFCGQGLVGILYSSRDRTNFSIANHTAIDHHHLFQATPVNFFSHVKGIIYSENHYEKVT